MSNSDTLRVSASEVKAHRIGASLVCKHCGIPKAKKHFEEKSVVCKQCAPNFIALQRGSITQEDVKKTHFELALDALRQTQTPALPTGVRNAKEILGGKTSTEILAEAISVTLNKHLPEEEQKFTPIDQHLLTRQLELLQRAEIKSDDSLKHAPPATADMSTEQLTAIMIDRAVNEMVHDRTLRQKILKLMFERVPEFPGEVHTLMKESLRDPTT